ncbi:MAG TPA: stage IV sporulation protein A, partial [Firmicutes bacterium]|nr:stage IV sporulation protein A [Bacillota bacterium]
MEKFDLFRDIAERTGGDIYIGVVGPVRTGKSTFIKRFMELLVLPNIADGPEKERALDELPQSGGGRTIMTTEPKFIPEEAVEVTIKENTTLRIRMVDCVGYCVQGALGYEEEAGPRMVQTPWFEEAVPFQEAAEAGTKKVISEHSTIGLVITTDGTITEIPRENYEEAEQRVIEELQELGKPYVIVLNSVLPEAPETRAMAEELQERYQVPVLPMDVARLSLDDIYTTLQEVLYEFPVGEVNVDLPAWVETLDTDHWLRQKFTGATQEAVSRIKRVRDIDQAIDVFENYDFVRNAILAALDLGSGIGRIRIIPQEGLLYKVMEEITGAPLANEADLLRLLREYTFAKREYDKVADALRDVERTGYGIVQPQLDEMILEEPELVRHGNRFGVRLRASAPSLHMIRADIKAEVSPIVGTEKQCEELVQYLTEEFEDNPAKLWQSNIFGKSLHE